MAQPTPYSPDFDFSDFQTSSPTSPLPADKVDAEFNALEITTDEILANLALIQRDDGALANSSVHLDALSTAVKNTMLLSAVSIKGDFAASTAYAVGDVVVDDGTPYLCFVAHTSGASLDLTKFVAITAPLEVPGNPDDDDKFLRASGGEGVWVDLTTAMITDIASDIQDVLTADTLALARTALGLTSVGDDLSTAASAAAARTTLGATAIGSTIFTAADAAAVITALAVPTLAAANEFTADQEISSASADATEGPLLTLDRVSASPADNDLLGAILFNGVSDLPTARTMAKILSQVLDVSNATEDAILAFQTIVAGTLATRGYFGGGLVVGAPTGGDKGAGIINAEDVQIDGESISGGSGIWSEIAEGVAAGVAAIDFTFNNSLYRAIKIVFSDALPVTDGAILLLRTDSSSGASFDAGASDYQYFNNNISSAGVAVAGGSTGADGIPITGPQGNGATEYASGEVILLAPASAIRKTAKVWTVYSGTDSNFNFKHGGGIRLAAAGVNALRLTYSTGNMQTLTYKVLGLAE